jgi:hypothetical protein
MTPDVQVGADIVWNSIGKYVVYSGILFVIAFAVAVVAWHGLIVPFVRDIGQAFFGGLSQRKR